MIIGEYLKIKNESDIKSYCCSKCEQRLSSIKENYKLGCLLYETTLEHSAPLNGNPHRFIDDEMVWREFYCPKCGTLLESELSRKGDPILWDIQLHL